MPDQAIKLSAENDGQTITLEPGAEFTVILESNPTTGYMWAVTAIDEAIITSTSNKYVGDPAPEDITGMGGREIWKFQAVGSGATTLQMEYRRHWEPDQPDDTFTVKLAVK